MTIAENIARVQARIGAAAARSGRRPEEVTLVAVTKLHEVSEIAEAAAAGLTELGENKVQELLGKIDRLDAPVHWHLIGHLQTNKVKQIVGKVCLVHSVDSMRLAAELERRAAQAGVVQDVLVQVNAAGEESKFGAAPEETPALVLAIREDCPHLRARGLMFVAPAADDPEEVRPYFRQVKKLFDSLASGEDWNCLSMGMSGDFEVAIEEGSTLVRVGTALFGARDYTKTL